MSLLQVNDLSVDYGPINAIKSLSLNVDEGQIVGMIGRNGAGKSTTMRAICGLHAATRGSVTFNGQRIDHLPAHDVLKHGVAYVPEGRHVFPEMSVIDNLRIGAYLKYRAGKKKEVEDNLERCFSLFPVLQERSAQLSGTLSGGQQQMLAISRALMSSPRLLLLDEPSMGLAPVIVNELFDSIKAMTGEGITLLIVEQKAFLTLKMVDYAYVISNGEVTISGTGGELLDNEEVRVAYLGQGEHAAKASASADHKTVPINPAAQTAADNTQENPDDMSKIIDRTRPLAQGLTTYGRKDVTEDSESSFVSMPVIDRTVLPGREVDVSKNKQNAEHGISSQQSDLLSGIEMPEALFTKDVPPWQKPVIDRTRIPGENQSSAFLASTQDEQQTIIDRTLQADLTYGSNERYPRAHSNSPVIDRTLAVAENTAVNQNYVADSANPKDKYKGLGANPRATNAPE